MLLYPRLPQTAASSLAGDLSTKSVPYLFNISALEHPAAIYAPTGGSRVGKTQLLEIQVHIREIARRFGYPTQLNDTRRRGFDTDSGRILHEMMEITPTEASKQGVWAFMACVMLPDIVRWRFPGAARVTSKERFLGGSRGLRNTFGRVWWRAYTLKQRDKDQPYELLGLLGEDELVQIMERPSLAGNPPLAKQVGRSFLDTVLYYSDIPRSELLRDAMKRLRRLLPLVSFDTLEDEVLRDLIDEIFGYSVTSLSGTHTVQS